MFKNLLERIKMPWTFIRFVYLILGATVLFQGVYEQLWLGAVVGVYFTFMGLFSWGCASGNCAIPNQPEKLKK